MTKDQKILSLHPNKKKRERQNAPIKDRVTEIEDQVERLTLALLDLRSDVRSMQKLLRGILKTISHPASLHTDTKDSADRDHQDVDAQEQPLSSADKS